MAAANPGTRFPTRGSLLSKLSLVIFTYERQNYALRNMRYWSGTDVRVYVLDGSAKGIEASSLNGLGPNISYRHLPISIWQRIAVAPEIIDSEYVAFLPDDEFFIPSAVEACLLELDSDPELVACYGQGIGKSLASDLVVHASVLESERLKCRGGASGEVALADPVGRMIAHMNPYVPTTIYGICRGRAWKEAVRLISGRQYACGVAPEVQFELAMSFHGKTKAINELMWLRSAENPPSVDGFELAFDSWFLDQRYAAEVTDFIDLTAHNLAEARGGLGFSEIRSGLVRACDAYVAYCRSQVANKQAGGDPGPERVGSSGFLQVIKKQVKKFASILPEPLLAVLPVQLRFRPYADIAKGMETAGIKVDRAQLATILKIVRDFHDRKSKTIAI